MSSGEKKAIPKKQASILSYLPVPEQAEMKGRPKYVVRTEIAKKLPNEETGEWVYGHVDRHKFDDDNNEEELLYHVTFPNGFHQPEYLSESEMDWGVCVRTHLNCKIAKYFDIDGKQELYLGYVHDAVPADLNDPNVVLFEVVYDDGDREDMEEKDLLEAKSLYQENDKEEKKDATPPKRRKRKQAGSKTTGVKDIGEGEDESPPFKSRASSRASKCNGANDDNDNDSDDNASLSGLPSTSTKRNIKVKVKEEEVKKQPPRSSRGKRKAAVKSESEEDEPDVKPSRSKRKAAATVKNEEDVTDISDEGAAARHHEPVAFSRSGRRRKAVSYKENDLVVVVGDSDEEEEQPKKKKGIKKAAPAAKGSKRKDEDDFELVDSSSDEELEDESDDELEDESDDESVQAAPAKKKNATKPKAKPATAKGKTTTPSDSGKKSMAESFEPMDRPLYSNLSLAEIRKTKRFLDPCGQEATDDIIGRLVGQQVDKIQSLFKRAMENGNLLGGTGMPLKLGTACSGTDAPSLALTLVQEQLELRGLGDLFHHTHAFSCENEPFKQAYLARNFDSVLYPDICKLTDDEPRDVFGQVQPIPDFNLFVAGTSCKNFSMLRATQRLDIEDKGCSGETFLAAVEFLFEQKPPFAIFENVQNAPWDKMSEYITGKIKLSSCAEKKAITGVKKNDKQDLEFVHQNGKIIVDKVPMVFGVRCGVAVAGYHRPGETKLRHVAWPSKKKERCTLADLLVENKIKKKDDTLVFDMPIRYHTTKAKVDTKDFGLPQTRSRMYLFVWKSEDGDDLGDYWKAIVEHLKSPVRHSLEAFILQEDHDIIRVFREALRGPLGRATKRGAFLESNFWESTNANLPHNKIAREKLGLEDMARTLTEWGPHGKKQLPPHYWLEFVNCCNQRQIDLLDILHASAARDAETHDSSFASFVWNISQNASREKHRSACPGISGCVTPGGEFFLPHLGRPLLGCEKLLLQGIPYFRLALGTETEVQLGDLAGNAMSLTVVCATMLAAMTCKQLREEVKATKPSAPMPAAGRILQASSIDRKPLLTATGQDEFLQVNDNLEFIRELASLSEDAIRTSIWCTCETSGQNTTEKEFLQCSICKMSCCRNCCDSHAGYQVQSHRTTEFVFSEETRDVGSFEDRLRNVVPPAVVFNKEGLSQVSKSAITSHDVSTLAGLKFTLHRIYRERRSWQVIYFARECNVGEALAEFRIRVGELSTVHGNGEEESGALCELTSFLPAKVTPLVYGQLKPTAILRCVRLAADSLQIDGWKSKSISTTGPLKIVGSLPAPSFRSETGLTQVASDSMKETSEKSHNRKSFAQAKSHGEEQRWRYVKNWENWPDTLDISACSQKMMDANIVNVSGTYHRSQCRQTVNQGALWIRDKSPALYLILKPEVSRTGPDCAVISQSLSHDDASCIVATLPANWQPCDALRPDLHVVPEVQFNGWTNLEEMKCVVPASSINVSSPVVGVETDVLLTVSGLTKSDTEILAFHANKDNADPVILPMATGQRAQQTVRAFNSICVAKILQSVASAGIRYDLRPSAKWIDIAPADAQVSFGTCKKTFPPRPTEHWRFIEERKEWERMCEQAESRAFHQALEKRPRAFEFVLEKAAGTLTVKLHPEVVAHYAAGYLAQGRGHGLSEGIKVAVKLSASQFQTDPILDAFRVPSCRAEPPTDVQIKEPYHLYERQQKALTKMIAIENGQTKFNEMEMYEEYMPGSTGWSLIAKAEREASISGGVIADAIGAGKTVISIALILKGMKEARENAALPNKSSATLVVVPGHLILQWQGEFEKFAPHLKVLCIYDADSLLNVRVQDLIHADCVICPVDILETKGYLQHLLEISGRDTEDCPIIPSYTGQKEQFGASGVWIPATSADPYGGANNPNNQKRRNASARYTHIYLTAVHKLRTKKFTDSKKGVPLEYFEWERIIVDEIHESLCCTKQEIDESNKTKKDGAVFKEKNRRAGRELLGIMTKNPRERPLVHRKSIFGLTGTPLLDSPSRVIELASLIGSTYVLGLSSHWRKLERESSRDIFLHYYLEPKQSREIRRNLYAKCQDYITTACCRNKVEEELNGIKLNTQIASIKMTDEEGKLYLKSQSGISPHKKSFAISPEDFDVSAGHDIVRFLRQNADLACRKEKLVNLCQSILAKDGGTKIVVFADGRIGGGIAAREALCAEGGSGCTWLDKTDSNEIRNQKIAWYQHGDATEEDRARPRVLVLHFEHAAGLNLQTECYNLILFTPLYVGEGGANSDPVADVSTEEQAIGRVFRPGQTKPVVNVYRIEVKGPNGEDCLDGQIICRNTDEETKKMAVNAED